MRGTNPTYMTKKALHLHLAHVRNQSNMHIQKVPTLTSNTCEEPIQHVCSKGRALTYDLVGTKSYTLVRMAPSPRLSYLVTDQVPPFPEWKQPLYLIKWEPIPQSIQNGHVLTSDHLRLHIIVILERPLVLDRVFLVTDQEPPFQEWHSMLISDHVGTNPIVTSEWLNTHI